MKTTPKPGRPPAAAGLAARFGQVLAEWLTPAELAEAVRLNAAETNPHICHTHDFCDANMAMDEAFRRFRGRPATDTGGPGIGAMSAEASELWNAAWARARQNQFQPNPETPEPEPRTPKVS